MKTFAIIILMLGTSATLAFASPNPPRVYVDRNGDHYIYEKITGSLIPQQVKVSAGGQTNSASPVTIWNRRRIDSTGRATLSGVLAQDPSITARRGP
ncbi:MAG: hypothetical protein ACREIW_07660 [Chthoniobacterales bacterium]